MSKQTYSTFEEKVAAFRKGKSQSAVILYSAPQQLKFETRPATICPDGFPQLVAAFSPKQVQQYQDMGYKVYTPAKVAESLKTGDEGEAPKRTRKIAGDEQQ